LTRCFDSQKKPAEGIETEQEVTELIRLGVPLGQGYLFGKPAPLPAN